MEENNNETNSNEIENTAEEKVETSTESTTEEVVVENVLDAEEEIEEEFSPEAVTEDKSKAKPKGRGGGGGRGGPGAANHKKKSSRRKGRAETEENSEFIEKVVQVRRVTKVVKGGKKLSFRTTVIIGNEKGKVGVGVGKASEVLIAIKKAIADARKNLVDIETVANTNTISHTVIGKSGGGRVLLKPAAEGTGIIAGGTARIVLELAGVGDILSKSLGSKSPLNVARATVNALGSLRKFQEVAGSRSMSLKKMLFA